ncbi:MAG: polysaccharide pyruvyl transferase family protein [Flavobacteriales bacterium]|nr:polysaccharide pyruvyl transferase family protein [Flavobacteriales bacterium]
MVTKNQYVILTGSKNNAGDYLIKYRAKKLLALLRPDRSVIDYDGWKPFSKEQVIEINESKALILLGGPALQSGMRSRIYPMVNNLAEISIPIIMLGVGYKGVEGTWEETYNYPLDEGSVELLRKINASGFMSSVRDYHTLNVLRQKGFNNFIMTGCPALYSLDHLNKQVEFKSKPEKIGFSLGVSYYRSSSMEKQMKDLIFLLSKKTEFNLEVLFHHKIDRSILKQNKFVEWLEKEHINYKDISGSENGLIDSYSACDLHIGYRVHAHIFCCSISKPSVLLSEDGRGVALKEVIGGLSLKAYTGYGNQLTLKAANKMGLYDIFKTDPGFAQDVVNNLEYEIEQKYPRISLCRKAIDGYYTQMQKVISQLP